MDVELIYGCMDSVAMNYNAFATVDNDSCDYLGCMDIYAINYNESATIDDGNCIDASAIPEQYILYWNDEFNGEILNSKFWNIEIMPSGANNNELQSYTENENNIYIYDGYLHIRAVKDSPFDPNQPKYKSGRINTKGKVEISRGQIEVRAKLPTGTGTWPAIWMLGSDIESKGWPACGEIDIMEHVGHDPNWVFFSIHNKQLYGDVGGTDQQGMYYLNDMEDEFHIYKIKWDDNEIQGLVDDYLYFNYQRSNSNISNEWPYNAPFFLILNLAIGGDWGGQQGIDNSIFPASFIIDYVRMFVK